VDVVDPSAPFSVARFQALGREAAAGIRERGHEILLSGGTVLYFRALVDDLGFPPTDPAVRSSLEAEADRVGAIAMYGRLARSDPVAAGKIEPSNVRRTIRALEVARVTGRPFSSFAEAWGRYEPSRVRGAGIRVPPDALSRRIERRVAWMIEHGLLDEVRGLVAAGFGSWITSSQAIGYAEFARHMAGDLTLEEAVAGTVKRTRALARRQLAFLRRDPRIRWFDAGEDGAAPLVEELTEYLRG
jgi:tRNA dimethylallyltransferase